MSSAPSGSGDRSVYQDDEKLLHRLGYAQQLFRGDGRVPELRDLVHDHLDPRGLPDLVLGRVRARRPGRDHVGLAARRRHEHDHRPRDGGDRVVVSDGRRPVLLGLEARQPRLGLGDRLVQPDRPDRRDGVDRLRPRDVRDDPAQLLVRLPERELLDLLPLLRVPRGGGDHQHVPGQRHRVPEHDLGVLAHGRRRVDRAGPDRRARPAPVDRLRLHRDGEQLRLRRGRARLLEPRLLVRVRARAAVVAVHDHRLRRLGAPRRGDQQRVAHGGGRACTCPSSPR